MAGVVFGKPKLTVVTDRRGDGGGANQSPGYCDIIRATSKLAKHGRVRHTVTMVGPVGATFNAPAVYITKHRVRGSIGLVPLVLVPGQPASAPSFQAIDVRSSTTSSGGPSRTRSSALTSLLAGRSGELPTARRHGSKPRLRLPVAEATPPPPPPLTRRPAGRVCKQTLTLSVPAGSRRSHAPIGEVQQHASSRSNRRSEDAA